MKTALTLSPDPIDEAALAKARSISDDMGAVVTFSGVVRGREDEASYHQHRLRIVR